MSRQIKNGVTSNIVRFVLKNSSTGMGLTGLVFNSAGLIISGVCDNEVSAVTYTVAGSTIENITTLGTYEEPTATKCRFKEVDATNHPGLYEFHFADARFAVANSRQLVISVSGAASLLDTDYEIELVAFDSQDSVRLGLTALPDAAADAAGGLPISDAGGLDLDSKLANAVPTAVAIAAEVAAPTVVQILAGVIEGTTNLKHALQAMLAFVAGKATGGGTTSIKFRDQADAKDRLTMTVDSSGNRSAVVKDYD